MGTTSAAAARVVSLDEVLIEVPVTARELELLQQVRMIQALGWGEIRVIIERGVLDRYVPAPMRKFGEGLTAVS